MNIRKIIIILILIGIIVAQFLHTVYLKINHRIDMSIYLSVLSRTEGHAIAGWMEAHFYVEQQAAKYMDETRTIVNKNYQRLYKRSYTPGEGRGDTNKDEVK